MDKEIIDCIIGVFLISGSGIVGMICDLVFDIESRAFYWLLGSLCTFAGSIILFT